MAVLDNLSPFLTPFYDGFWHDGMDFSDRLRYVLRVGFCIMILHTRRSFICISFFFLHGWYRSRRRTIWAQSLSSD